MTTGDRVVPINRSTIQWLAAAFRRDPSAVGQSELCRAVQEVLFQADHVVAPGGTPTFPSADPRVEGFDDDDDHAREDEDDQPVVPVRGKRRKKVEAKPQSDSGTDKAAAQRTEEADDDIVESVKLRTEAMRLGRQLHGDITKEASGVASPHTWNVTAGGGGGGTHGSGSGSHPLHVVVDAGITEIQRRMAEQTLAATKSLAPAVDSFRDLGRVLDVQVGGPAMQTQMQKLTEEARRNGWIE